MNKKTKQEMLKYVGDLSALFGIKSYTFNTGFADGVRAYDVKNGKGLELTVLADRCMDIPYLSYKGTNIGFVSKTGIAHPKYFTDDGGVKNFLRRFNGGFLSTCGIVHSGSPCEYNGHKRGLHGLIGNTPAENPSAQVKYDMADNAVIHLTGSMREACVFDENLYLHRDMLIETETNIIHITDTIENCGFSRQPVMNIYHCNFGYPMLDEGARIYVSADEITPRTEVAAQGIDTFDVMEEPQEGYEEQCFYHTYKEAGENSAFAMLHNPSLGLAVVLHYRPDECPLMCEWKCMAAGDYALGLEPTVAGVAGVKVAEENGTIRYINPGETKQFHLSFEFVEDEAIINDYINRSKHY